MNIKFVIHNLLLKQDRSLSNIEILVNKLQNELKEIDNYIIDDKLTKEFIIESIKRFGLITLYNLHGDTKQRYNDYKDFLVRLFTYSKYLLKVLKSQIIKYYPYKNRKIMKELFIKYIQYLTLFHNHPRFPKHIDLLMKIWNNWLKNNNYERIINYVRQDKTQIIHNLDFPKHIQIELIDKSCSNKIAFSIQIIDMLDKHNPQILEELNYNSYNYAPY